MKDKHFLVSLILMIIIAVYLPAEDIEDSSWISLIGENANAKTLDWDCSLSSMIRSSIDAEESINLLNTFTLSINGHPIPRFYYDLSIGINLDQINPDTFPPYTFSKEWDGFHFWTGEDRYSDGINDHLNISSFSSTEIVFEAIDDILYLRWAKKRRNWGVGEHSLLLSDTARPFDAIEGELRMADWIRLDFLTGSLTRYVGPAHPEGETSGEKMFSLHRLQADPVPWLQFTVYEAVVWGKRFELSYLNPIMSYYLAQNMVGDKDNIAFGGDLVIGLPYGGVKLYGSFFLDEIVIDSVGKKFFKLLKNQYAFYSGVRIPTKSYFGIPTEFIIQYTKLEPYVYTHYPEVYAFSSKPIDVGYTHDGENLGYPLPPNTDEILFKFTAQPRNDLSLNANYRYIRHGTGKHEDGQVEGDIDIWLDYGKMMEYPDKDFLSDGIYEYIHVLTVSSTWKPKMIPLELTAEYSFVRGMNYNNVEGNNVMNNLFCLYAGFSFY